MTASNSLDELTCIRMRAARHRRHLIGGVVLAAMLLVMVCGGCREQSVSESPAVSGNSARPGNEPKSAGIGGSDGRDGRDEKDKGRTKSVASEPPHLSEKINLLPLNSDQLEVWIRQQTADVILVDYWATWCVPCVEKLPKVVELDLKYRGSGLVVIGVSMDEPDEAEQVGEFLSARDATYAQAIRREGASAAFEDFDLDAIPVYRLYRPSGELLKTFEGEFTMDEVEAAIRENLR